MTTLSPRARRPAGSSQDAIRDESTRHVLKLVASWGLPRDRQFRGREDVALWFDTLDRADVRTVADVWAHR
jgi:hypothetical protein